MTGSRVRWQVAAVAVFFLLVAVLPAYYVMHKPFTGVMVLPAPIISGGLASVFVALLNRVADLLLLTVVLAVAAAWGSRVMRWLGLTPASGLERWSLGATLGLGLLGTLVFGIGVAGGLYRWVGYLLLVVLVLTALPEIWALARWICTAPRRWRPSGIPWLWLFNALSGLLALGLALLPPSGWDALVYHLQGPRLYLEAHRLVAVPENFYLNWPAQIEMLFTWGMLLKGDVLAKLFNWSFWLLIAAMLYALGRRWAGARVGEWAVALWAAVPLTIEVAGVAYVDLGLTAFALAGFWGLMRWTEVRRDGWLVLSALFAGFAISVKYTAATWLGLLILLFVYHAWRYQRQRIGWILVRAVRFAAIAGVVVLPWLVKNWIVTGNPIYPFLFGGVGWNATREAWLYWPGQGYSQNLIDYLALPWLMTVLGTAGTAAFDATTGPLLLCLVPLVFLVRDRPRMVNYGLALAAAQFSLFAVMIWRYLYLAQTRLLIADFPLLCLAAAYALDKLPLWDRRTLRLSWIVGVVVTLVLIVTLLTEAQAFLALRPFAPLVGLESREESLARKMGYYSEAMRFINNRLPVGSRTVYLWEPRGYYGQSQDLADPTLDNLSQLRVNHHEDVEAALIALRAKGISHLLYYRSGMEFLQDPTLPPPTLISLFGPAQWERSLYPLTDADLQFLEDLLSRCSVDGDLSGVYQFYGLP
jgi:hypothetical protein